MAQASWQDLVGKAAEGGFTVLDDGVYELQVKTGKVVESSTGKPMIRAVFNVLSGPSAGKVVSTDIVLTTDNEQALNIFMRKLQNLGVDPANYVQYDQDTALAMIAQAIQGAVITTKIGHHTWNKQVRNDVDLLSPQKIAQPAGSGPVAAAPAAPAAVAAETPEVPQPPPVPGAAPF